MNNMDLQEIKEYIYPQKEHYEQWHELLPSYQLECVKWLIKEVERYESVLEPIAKYIIETNKTETP